MVPLPKRPNAKELGESRSQAVKRFISFEKSMHTKGQFSEVEGVMDEYFASKHAERVPQIDLEKPPSQAFYLPIHVVRKYNNKVTCCLSSSDDTIPLTIPW